ncbi:hypothetical protein [Melittangium boletus]|uniref:hypothetical protein n=1 Tax=Melittangium boletus TaxID=83453 RepID=UPI003DA61C62
MSLSPAISSRPPNLPPLPRAQAETPAARAPPPPEVKPTPSAAQSTPRSQDTFEAQRPTGASQPPSATSAASALKPPPARSGEELAKDEVDVKTATDLRAQTEEAQATLKTEGTRQVDDLFAMAAGKVPPPTGTTVTQVSESEARLTRVDGTGAVLETTSASRGANGAFNLNTATYENGINTRDQVEFSAEGHSRVRHAEWASETNEATTLKPFEEFNAKRDAGLVYSDAQVRKEGDTLVSEDFSQAQGGVKGSKTFFLMGKGDGGIDDKLDGLFDYKKPVGRADTYSYSIPAPGADGSQGNPQYQRIQRFSQEKSQVTSFVDRDLDGHTRFAGQGPHNREDFEKVRAEYARGGGENYDADDGTKKGKTPKRWLAEVQKGPDAKETQTFLEGTPDATTTTRLSREGSTVKEHFEGKQFKPGSSDLGQVKGDATRTYAPDGSLEKMASANTEADGTEVKQNYGSRREQTDGGLLLNETLESSRTKDGQTYTSKKEDTSALSAEGAQLRSSRTTVTDPQGRQGVSSLTGDGQTFTLSGPGGVDPREVANLEALAQDEAGKELVTQAGISTVDTLQSYARSGGAQALKAFQGIAADSVLAAGGKAADVLGKGVLERGLQGAKGGAAALGGAAGVVAGGMQLAQGIRDHNVPSIFKGLADLGVGGLDLYSAGSSLYNTATKVSDLALDASDDVARLAGGWLGKATGLSALASTGVGAKVLGAVKGLGGAANVVGAVVGTGVGVADIVNGVRQGDAAQIAKGAVSITGGIGGAVAAVAAGSAFGGPIGAAVGAVVGLATFGITQIIDKFSDKEHKISGLKLNLDNT